MDGINYKEINSASDSDVDVQKAILTKSRLSKILAKTPIPIEYYRKLNSKKIKLSRYGDDLLIVD